MRDDKVSEELYRLVMERDKECTARRLDYGQSGKCWGPLTLDHVKWQPRMGKRAESDYFHLVVLCYYHHLGSSWATSHRRIQRAYLEALLRKAQEMKAKGYVFPEEVERCL